MVEPRHVALDEGGVGLEKGERVPWHVLEPRENPLLGALLQLEVHRPREVRGGQDRLERARAVARPQELPYRLRKPGVDAPAHRALRIERRAKGRQRDGRVGLAGLGKGVGRDEGVELAPSREVKVELVPRDSSAWSNRGGGAGETALPKPTCDVDRGRQPFADAARGTAADGASESCGASERWRERCGGKAAPLEEGPHRCRACRIAAEPHAPVNG